LIRDAGENADWMCFHVTPLDTVICFDTRKAGLSEDSTILFPFGAEVTEDPVMDAYAWEEQSIHQLCKKWDGRTDSPVYTAINWLDPLGITEENENYLV